MYKVKFPNASIEKKFFKDLKDIEPKHIQSKMLNEALSLANNPRPKGEPKIKPPLEIYNFVAQYRLSIDNYRVLYDVDDHTKTVWIFGIRKRNERTYR